MASAVAMMISGAVVNALAFSGSNYLFSMMRASGVDEERKRHDLAIEQLQTAQEAYSRKRAERLDFINDELRRQGHAIQNFRDVDSAIREYAQVTGRTMEALPKEPQLADFYMPSDSQKDREIAFIVCGMVLTGGIAYMISKRK